MRAAREFGDNAEMPNGRIRTLAALLLAALLPGGCATSPPAPPDMAASPFDPTGDWRMTRPATGRAVVTDRAGRATAPASIPAPADPDNVTGDFPDHMNLEYAAATRQLSIFFTFDFYYDVPLGDDHRGALEAARWQARPVARGCLRRTSYSIRAALDDAPTMRLTIAEEMRFLAPDAPTACADYLRAARANFGKPDGDTLLAALDAAGLLPAAAEDLARINLEYVIEGRRAAPNVNSIDSCGDAKSLLRFSPVVDPRDPAAIARDLAAVGPLGNFAPSGHVYPTQHIYFYPRVAPGTPDQVIPVPVFAPADLRVYGAGTTTRFTDGTFTSPLYTEYRLDWAICREVKGYFLQIDDLEPAVRTQLGLDSPDGAECHDSQNGNAYYRECNKPLDFVRLPAGTRLGRAGRPATKSTPAVFSLDFGLQDRRVPHVTANPFLNPGWDAHAICPLDEFTADSPAAALRALLGGLDETGTFRAAPGCGSAYWDVPGTARGIWIDPDARSPNQDPNITLAVDPIDPKLGVFSLGERVYSAGFQAQYAGQPRAIGRTAWVFPLAAAPGTINVPFDSIKAGDPTIYCYEQLRDQYRRADPAALGAVFYVQAAGDGTLRFDADNAHKTCPPAGARTFGPGALTFRR